jgi:hypothetical protein
LPVPVEKKKQKKKKKNKKQWELGYIILDMPLNKGGVPSVIKFR